jgi:hypothetical protein
MANMIIRPATGTGNKVIVQDQAGAAVLTTADSGSTIANSTLDNATQDSITRLGTVTSGSLEAGVNLNGAQVFKHIKHYSVTGYTYGGGAENIKGWYLNTSDAFLNRGSNFSINANGELTFPEAGFWMVTAHLAFYKAANGLNTNMEPLMQIHNGSSWGNSKYMRVGEQYDGSTYTRGGGQKVSFYDILSTSYKWRMYPPSASSGPTIADSTSVEFVYIGAT